MRESWSPCTRESRLSRNHVRASTTTAAESTVNGSETVPDESALAAPPSVLPAPRWSSPDAAVGPETDRFGQLKLHPDMPDGSLYRSTPCSAARYAATPSSAKNRSRRRRPPPVSPWRTGPASKAVQRLLGHTSAAMALDRYAGPDRQNRRSFTKALTRTNRRGAAGARTHDPGNIKTDGPNGVLTCGYAVASDRGGSNPRVMPGLLLPELCRPAGHVKNTRAGPGDRRRRARSPRHGGERIRSVPAHRVGYRRWGQSRCWTGPTRP